MRRHIHRFAYGVERHLDRRLSGRRRSGTRLVISPYRGFGREHEILVRGRVLCEKGITRATDAESTLRNLVNAYRRFQSDEVPGIRIVAKYGDSVVESVTDDEGHFTIRLEPTTIDPTLWHEVVLEMPESSTTATAHAIVPTSESRFGIISDIDDTILQTNATSMLKMARTVFLSNAATRLPFEGVADLYRLLQSKANPIFYVSSSPWNLYELLHDFMDLKGIPHGPMFLQDWGIDETTFLSDAHETHKLEQIQLLLEYYPHLSFVLLGDSGQHDPEIYLRVIQSNPHRVLAAFIRDVTHDVRDQGVARIMEEAKAAGVEMLYVKDSAEAMAHVKRLGLGTPGPEDIPEPLPA